MPSRPPQVSVVMPTWNRRAEVGGAVESVLAQTLGDFELIVVDDGSTDGTADLVREAYGKDRRVRVLEKENGGCGSARNLGVARARAPLVALLDSDDRMLPHRLERQVEVLDAAPALDLSFCDARYETAEGRVLGTMLQHKGFVAPLSLEAMFHAAWAIPSTWVLRTAILQALPFDENVRYQEDVDFLFRFHRAGHRARLLREILILYRADDPAAKTSDRMSENQAEMDHYWTGIQERNWAALDEQERRAIHRPTAVHRRLAQHYLRVGDQAKATPHCKAWWLARPWRLRPLLRWLRARRAAR